MHLLLCAMLPLVATLHLTSAAAAAAAESDSAASSASPLTGSSARHKRESRVMDLSALRDNLASIEDNLSEFQKRSCAVGLNSHHCSIAHLDDVMKNHDYLSGGFSPGKRSSSQLPDDVRTQAEMLLQNLSEQKQAVRTLRHLLGKLEATSERQEKRTCAFRLGNHCLTEALDHAANQYYYLQSPASPGRRRRQASATLAQGEQQQGDRESRHLRLRRSSSSNSNANTNGRQHRRRQ